MYGLPTASLLGLLASVAMAHFKRRNMANLRLANLRRTGTPSRAKRTRTSRTPRVLVVDVGGTSVKILATGQDEHRSFPSGPRLTPRQMVTGVKKLARDWSYDAVSVGYPGPVLHGRPIREPYNLGRGWVGFDFAAAFGYPAKVINDAALQALGSYRGGKMLFLGLGTGLGSTMIVDGMVEPMELGHLPYKKGTYEDYVGHAGLKRHGKKKWRRHVAEVVALFVAALEPDDVVIGGGNVKKLAALPRLSRAGDNTNAFRGGFRLWESDRAGSMLLHKPKFSVNRRGRRMQRRRRR